MTIAEYFEYSDDYDVTGLPVTKTFDKLPNMYVWNSTTWNRNTGHINVVYVVGEDNINIWKLLGFTPMGCSSFKFNGGFPDDTLKNFVHKPEFVSRYLNYMNISAADTHLILSHYVKKFGSFYSVVEYFNHKFIVTNKFMKYTLGEDGLINPSDMEIFSSELLNIKFSFIGAYLKHIEDNINHYHNKIHTIIKSLNVFKDRIEGKGGEMKACHDAIESFMKKYAG